MKALITLLAAVGVMAGANAFAAAPAGAPAGTMGMCNDGSYSSSAEKKGACRGHKGVKAWYEEDRATTAPNSTTTATTTAAPAAPGSVTKTTKKSETSVMGGRSVDPATVQQAAGGGAGMVWVNDNTKVYHCNGDRWYGKTKHGSYMSEADAKTKGFHGDHGKSCA